MTCVKVRILISFLSILLLFLLLYTKSSCVCCSITAIAAFSYETDENVKERKKNEALKDTVPFYLKKLDDLVKLNGGYLANSTVRILSFRGHLSLTMYYNSSYHLLILVSI